MKTTQLAVDLVSGAPLADDGEAAQAQAQVGAQSQLQLQLQLQLQAQALAETLRAAPALAAWARAHGRPEGDEGLCVEWVEQTASTNADLLEQAFGVLAAGPRVRLSERQTAGRGRQGRPWQTVAGASLALSVALERVVPAPAQQGLQGPAAHPWQGLSLAVGVALAQSLSALRAPEDLGLPHASGDILLKWPNDLWLHGRKLGGILIELRRNPRTAHPGGAERIERVVVGVGLNLFANAAWAQLDRPATALFESSPCAHRDGDPARAPVLVAARVVEAILSASLRLQDEGLAGVIGAWRARDALMGRTVRVEEPGAEPWVGVAAGIDHDGALRVESLQEGVRRVQAGTVSIRPL